LEGRRPGGRSALALPQCLAPLLATFIALAPFSAPADTAEPPPPVVFTAPVSAELLAPTRSLQGTVVAAREAELASRMEARVAWVAALGTQAKKGEVVARLEDAQARLAVARERARLERLQAERALAGRQLQRLQAMADAVPAAQRDEAQARGEVLGAQLAEARVALQLAQLQLDETTLEAPFAGTVVAELKQPGEQVLVGAPLLRLTDTERVELELAVPVELAGHAKVGAAVVVDGLAGSGVATIRAIVPGAAQTRQLRVRIALPGTAPAPVGAALAAQWPSAAAATALTVPMDALVRRSDGVHLLRVDRGVVRQIAVEVGNRAGDRVAVIGQIGPGDDVVVRGGERLTDGARVSVGTAPASALAALRKPVRSGT
jgi:RND family efflux transporter MFP subunit